MSEKALSVEEVQGMALKNLREMGIDADEVSVMYANAKSMRDNGFLIDLDITGLSMFEVAVNWTLDLGIDNKDARRYTRRIRPGRKLLLPDTKLLSITQRIRDNLARYSHAMAVFPGYRYVPNSALEKWWARHCELMIEFADYKDHLLNTWDELVSQCRQDFSKHARDTWPKLDAQVRRQYTQRGFVREVSGLAVAQFPSRERITKDLRVSLKPPATFLLESEYEAVLLEEQRLRQERTKEALQYDAYARKELARAAEDEARAEAARAEADVAEAKAQQEIELLAYEKSAKQEAIREIQIGIAKDAVANMVNPFLEAVNQNRAEVYRTVSDLARNIKNRGWVHGKEAGAIRRMSEWFSLMNIGDDQVLAGRLEQLASLVDSPNTGSASEYAYDPDQVLSALNQVMATAAHETEVLAQSMEVGALTMMDL